MSSEKEKIEFAKDILAHNFQLINFADTKSGIILGINGIILGLIVGVDAKILLGLMYSIIPAIIFLGISFIYSVFAILPRLTKINNTRLYYDVSKKDEQQFISSWESLTNQEILNEYLINIYRLSEIRFKKYRNLVVSIIALVIGLILLSIAVILNIYQISLQSI